DLVESLDFSTESGQQAYATLIGISGTFDQLVQSLDSEGDTGDALFAAQRDTMRDMAAETNRLLSLRNRAGTMLDQIDRTMGRTGAFGAQREAALWAAITTASYEQQVELAGELSRIVTDRIQAEIDASERMRDIARSMH